MTSVLQQRFEASSPQLEQGHPQYVSRLVDAILELARRVGASDVHLVPSEDGLSMLFRVDGVLHPVAAHPRSISPNIVARLKVLAELLTYQTDVPQEGRIRHAESPVEMRVSTFPTIFGEKCVVRLFLGSDEHRYVDGVGLPRDATESLKTLLLRRNGLILITGPAGSGKTTTIYACLREIVERSNTLRSAATLEDPVESVIPGVSQSQIRPHAGFDFDTGLKSMLRQDPEVIVVGEIRDRTTAQTAVQAALTGHLILTTFHAGSAVEALHRLLEMGIEPYQIGSALSAVLNQRLLRRLCGCSSAGDASTRMGLTVEHSRVAVGCDACQGTGYEGRMLIHELLLPDMHGGTMALLDAANAREMEESAVSAGMNTRWRRAEEAVNQGLTSAEEVRRVLGFE